MDGKIAVIGSSNTDMVVKTPKLPLPGETTLGGKFFMFPGGKGANQAVAAARLGGTVTFIARLGDDVFGKQALAGFRKEGIDTSFVGTDPDEPSGVALITVDAKGENVIAVAPGANARLSEADVDKAGGRLQGVDVLLLQLEVPLPTVVHAAKFGFAQGKKVILNPAPAQRLPDDLLPCLYLVTPNETEAEILTGIRVSDTESAARAAGLLHRKGVRQVVITLGARGAYVHTDEVATLVPAPQVTAVDTTAAGDVFNGALAVAIAKGSPIEPAVAFACRAAALSVTRMGAQASAPYLSELSTPSLFSNAQF
jgi:ribokinase